MFSENSCTNSKWYLILFNRYRLLNQKAAFAIYNFAINPAGE